MAGAANIFMEDPVVGGLPYIVSVTRKCLPKNKRKRDLVIRIQMIILTYVTYSFFNMARRPIAVVKSKIVEECSSTDSSWRTVEWLDGQIYNVSNEWCKETFFESTTEQFMGFLDSVYIFAYGVVLYASGVIADCYNPRFYLTAGCLMSGFFSCLLGLSDFWGIRSFKYLGMVLILFGASQSTSWPVALSCVTHWYSGGKRGMFFGFWNTHNYLGSVLGIFIAGSWVERHWGWSFCIPGFILAFMGIVVFLCMVADPGDLKELEKVEDEAPRPRLTGDLPQWLSASRSIKMYDAWTLPGVIEFSTCMFFSRIVGYIFLYWLPMFAMRANSEETPKHVAYYSIAYVLGGSLGGIVAGILVDIFRRSAIVCALFLLISIPILFLGQIYELGKHFEFDLPLLLLMGLFVEAPYIVTSTSVSADLGTHKMIKRNHRAISTIGGIMEGTGAIGAAIGTGIIGFLMARLQWTHILYIMMMLQFVATLCLSRQAYKDFFKKQERRTLKDYWKTQSMFK